LWNAGEPMGETFNEIVNSYMDENPKVKVNYVPIGRDSLTKFLAALKAGAEIPDIVNQGNQRIYNSLVVNDLALPFDDYMSTNAYGEEVPWSDIFIPALFDEWKKISGGKIYCIPHYIYTNAFWYDKNKFAEFGITDTPKTWDDFLATCETIKEKGGTPLSLDIFGEYCSFYMYWLINRTMGPGQLLMASLDPSGESFDAPEWLAAAKKVEDLHKKGYFQKGYEGYQYPAAQIEWAQGKMVYQLNGSWLLAEVRDNLPPEFDAGAFPFPTVDGKGELTDVEFYPSGFAIYKNTPNPEICVDFIKYCTTEESQTKIAAAGSASPVRKGVPSFKDIQVMFETATRSHHPMDNLAGMNPEWYVKIWAPDNIKLITGEVTAEEFISNLKQETIDFYKGK
jgi:raffinose/stachyose/melibiose transport system substrate-binding protein